MKTYKLTYGNEILQKDKKDFEEQCPGYEYLPTIYPAVRRIIVIGDIHGDYNMTIKVLKLAKVIDDNLNWIGGDTHVVQVGDQVDRCRPYIYPCNHPLGTCNDEASDIKILKLFTKLHKKAVKKGGAVISLLGNHELMNVTGQLTYVSYMGLKEFENYKDPKRPELKFKSGEEARKHAFKPGNEYGKFMGCTRQSAVIIGSSLFVHAGILPQFLNKLNINKPQDLVELNKNMREWLLKIPQKSNISDIVNGSPGSLFWTRVFGSIPANVDSTKLQQCEKYLEPVLKILKVGHMIVGHTPQFSVNNEGINSTCGNKLWRVDNGCSAAFHYFDKTFETSKQTNVMESRHIQILEILNDCEFKIIE